MEVFDWVKEGGFLALLLVVLLGIWRTAKWLGDKLFDTDKGLISQWVQDQREFVRSVAESNEVHAQAAVAQAAASEQTLAAVDAVVGNVRNSHEMLLAVLRVLQRVAEKLEIDITREINGIREKLRDR